MRLSLEREIDLHVEEELLVPKDESQDVDQPSCVASRMQIGQAAQWT
jgi:hypothetical protein